MPRIDVSPTVYEQLLRRSKSFDDTPDDVIRRMLGETDHSGAEANEAADQVLKPAPSAPRLPIESYRLPILSILDEAGGAAPSGHVIDALEARLGDALSDADRLRVRNGEVRWRNRARFARLRMKEQGLLSNTSQRGIWELTEVGRAYLRMGTADNA